MDTKLKEIQDDKEVNHAYTYNDGEKIYTEKEMILRSKLYKVDTVITGYFKHSSHENNTTSQIVKVNDVSALPTKSSKKG